MKHILIFFLVLFWVVQAENSLTLSSNPTNQITLSPTPHTLVLSPPHILQLPSSSQLILRQQNTRVTHQLTLSKQTPVPQVSPIPPSPQNLPKSTLKQIPAKKIPPKKPKVQSKAPNYQIFAGEYLYYSNAKFKNNDNADLFNFHIHGWYGIPFTSNDVILIMGRAIINPPITYIGAGGLGYQHNFSGETHMVRIFANIHAISIASTNHAYNYFVGMDYRKNTNAFELLGAFSPNKIFDTKDGLFATGNTYMASLYKFLLPTFATHFSYYYRNITYNTLEPISGFQFGLLFYKFFSKNILVDTYTAYDTANKFQLGLRIMVNFGYKDPFIYQYSGITLLPIS